MNQTVQQSSDDRVASRGSEGNDASTSQNESGHRTEFERLYDEVNSATIPHSDVDGVYVKTTSFSGEHRVWYSKHHGPRLKERGLYIADDDGRVEIECVPPWIDEVREHFAEHFGGSEHE